MHVRRIFYLILTINILFLNACFEPFPSFPELPNPRDPVVEDATLEIDMALVNDMIIDMEVRSDMDLDMSLSREDMEMIIDMELDMELDLGVDMEPPMRFEEVTALRCTEAGFVVAETSDPLSEGRACPQHLSEQGLEWLRIEPPTRVGFHLSSMEPSFTQITPDSTPAVVSLMMNPYYLMKREVSVGDFARCVEEGVCEGHPVEVLERVDCMVNRANEIDGFDRNQYPVNCVDWTQAQTFCKWIGGRLPSEMEWELAVTFHRTIFPIPWSIDQGSAEFQRYLMSKTDAFCAYSNYGNCRSINPFELNVRPSCHTYDLSVVDPALPQPSYIDDRLICDASGNVAEWILDDEDIVSNVAQSGAPTIRGEDEACRDQNKITRGGSYLNALPEGVGPNATTLYRLFYGVSYISREGVHCSERPAHIGFRCVLPSP